MEKLLKIEEVEEIVGFKKSWIYERIAEKTFPDSKKFGKASRWSYLKVQDWLKKQVDSDSAKAA